MLTAGRWHRSRTLWNYDVPVHSNVFKRNENWFKMYRSVIPDKNWARSTKTLVFQDWNVKGWSSYGLALLLVICSAQLVTVWRQLKGTCPNACRRFHRTFGITDWGYSLEVTSPGLEVKTWRNAIKDTWQVQPDLNKLRLWNELAAAILSTYKSVNRRRQT
jgi:hypothetical protein